MDKLKYQKFLPEDFIWDEDFRKWITAPSEASDKEWKEWQLENPAKIGNVDAAKEIIQAIRIKEKSFDAEEIDVEVNAVLLNINRFSKSKPGATVYSIRVFGRVAAVILLCILAIVLYYSIKPSSVDHQIVSGYGNIKEVILPDSSTIILNGNSSIRFASWKEDQPREVWLNGEGYFNVRHLNKTKVVSPKERFIVHVNNINVEVLGTTFDIRQRRNETVIVLNSGSISVSYNKRKGAKIMKPGDMAVFQGMKPDSATFSKVEAKEFASWTQKKLIVKNASVKEIFQYLEDNYGKVVRVEDQSVLDHKIEGTIMLDNLDDALFVLSKVLNVKIYNTDTSIIIKTNKKN